MFRQLSNFKGFERILVQVEVRTTGSFAGSKDFCEFWSVVSRVELQVEQKKKQANSFPCGRSVTSCEKTNKSRQQPPWPTSPLTPLPTPPLTTMALKPTLLLSLPPKALRWRGLNRVSARVTACCSSVGAATVFSLVCCCSDHGTHPLPHFFSERAHELFQDVLPPDPEGSRGQGCSRKPSGYRWDSRRYVHCLLVACFPSTSFSHQYSPKFVRLSVDWLYPELVTLSHLRV